MQKIAILKPAHLNISNAAELEQKMRDHGCELKIIDQAEYSDTVSVTGQMPIELSNLQISYTAVNAGRQTNQRNQEQYSRVMVDFYQGWKHNIETTVQCELPGHNLDGYAVDTRAGLKKKTDKRKAQWKNDSNRARFR